MRNEGKEHMLSPIPCLVRTGRVSMFVFAHVKSGIERLEVKKKDKGARGN